MPDRREYSLTLPLNAPIKLFFEISKEFFDSIYSQGLDYEDENNDISENLDEEKGLEDEEELCYCNACSVSRVFLSFISSEFLNHNKVD